MTILYLHGLREREGRIIETLRPYNTIIPPLDPWKPSETLREISDISADFIIGFSMGGFFGACLQTSTPKLLINPALCFPEIVCSRRNQDPSLSAEYMGLKVWPESNVKAIFTTEDHKIGLRSLPLYLESFPESSVAYIPGGHNPGEEIDCLIEKFLES